ncbi:MAG TPA: amidohydrolase family protein [Nitrososphaerales archaeon]|nr:amidohydrolase family protein [Nitrososphaerales archaeon]HUK74412.1 amidohydrolase family protein [Nitrososphaerales archaeon]
MSKVIDAHVHCSDGRKDDRLRAYAKLNGLRYDLAELLAEMEEKGVEKGLLLSPPMGKGDPLPNAEVVKLCEKSGDTLFPVLTVEPSKPAVKEGIALARREKGFVKAFKIWLGYRRVYAWDEVFAPLYDFGEEHGLPVMFHTGDTASSTGSLVHAHPLTLDELANEREGLRIVICHAGNPWIADTAELLYKHPNVYADISGLMVGGSPYEREYLAMMARRIDEAVYFSGGADKLLFGTDYPVETLESGLALVSALKVRPEDKEKILWRNASRLFSL